jgi:hypothetical protein
MKVTYIWLSRLIALAVVLQAAFITFGTFQVLHAADDGRAFTSDSGDNAGQALHSAFGYMVVPVLALAMLAVAFFARVHGAVRMAGIVLGLVVLQIVLALVSFPVPVLGTLHAINAFAIAAVAGIAGRQAGQPSAPPPASGAPATSAAPPERAAA